MTHVSFGNCSEGKKKAEHELAGRTEIAERGEWERRAEMSNAGSRFAEEDCVSVCTCI